MLGADGQKYFTLREKRKLLNDGLMKYTRNPNYLGEMMIYGSFAGLVDRWEPWAILIAIWSLLFFPRMLFKDIRLARKEGWAEYRKQSWILIPKLYGSAAVSVIVYGMALGVVAFCVKQGGIERGLKVLLK
mmetsp:Transcript_25692/g.39504  ORF Transcript_25692/g.39504 Transcript_25692/m.39504 type:complete len:131 (-) Transcript_25692:28-420(-)